MALLTNNQVQANIIKHQRDVKNKINSAISLLNGAVSEYSKMASFLQTEADKGEIIDNGDRNKTLNLIERKADKLQELVTAINALKALKGANGKETKANIEAHITATSYDHEEYEAQFLPE